VCVCVCVCVCGHCGVTVGSSFLTAKLHSAASVKDKDRSQSFINCEFMTEFYYP